MSESFHVNFNLFNPVILEKTPPYFCDYLPFEGGHGPWFEQTWIPFTQGWFVPSLIEISPVVLEKKIFSYIFACKTLTSLLWLHPTPRDHDFNKFEFALCQEASK